MNDFDSFAKAFEKLKHNIYRGTQVGIHKTLQQTREEVLRASKEPKSGRSYQIKRGSQKRVHIASSPSETSARITRGGKHDSTQFSVNGLTGALGVNKKIIYANAVEYGTKNMSARGDSRKAGDKIAKKNLTNNVLVGIINKVNAK